LIDIEFLLDQFKFGATWAGLQRGTSWHICLDWMHMSCRFFEEAIAHCEDTLNNLEGSNVWLALEHIARSYL